MPIRKIRNPYNFEKCRWCDHYFLSHTSMPDGNRFCEWAEGIYTPNRSKCECKDFAPQDNLEFLEYKYEQLGFVTSNKSNEDMPTQ